MPDRNLFLPCVSELKYFYIGNVLDAVRIYLDLSNTELFVGYSGLLTEARNARIRYAGGEIRVGSKDLKNFVISGFPETAERPFEGFQKQAQDILEGIGGRKI